MPRDPADPADPLDPLDPGMHSKIAVFEQHSHTFGYFFPLGENPRRGKKWYLFDPPGKSFSLIVGNIGPQGGPAYSPQKLSFL